MLPVMQRMLGLNAAAGGAAAPSLQPAANVARLPSAPAPRLRASATLREFESWKYMFEAHVAAHFGNEMSPVMQQAVLLSRWMKSGSGSYVSGYQCRREATCGLSWLPCTRTCGGSATRP